MGKPIDVVNACRNGLLYLEYCPVCDSPQSTEQFNNMERAYSTYLPWYLDDSMYISTLVLMQQESFFLQPRSTVFKSFPHSTQFLLNHILSYS